MNDRQGNDWINFQRLQKIRQEYLDEEDRTLKEQMKVQLQEMDKLYNAWKLKRLQGVVRQYGGIPEDYEFIQVPDDEKMLAMTAKYIAYDGTKLTYDIGPRYVIDEDNPGKIVVKAPQWVRGNYTLKQDDITNFREEEFAEDIRFSLEFFQNEDTLDIVVEIFCWGKLEEKGKNPPGKKYCHTICQGIYHHDTKIVEVQ